MRAVTLFVGDENGLRDVNKAVNKGSFKMQPLDAACTKILEDLFNGKKPLVGSGNKDVSNALTRLRRQGLIENQGTRTKPAWVLTNKTLSR